MEVHYESIAIAAWDVCGEIERGSCLCEVGRDMAILTDRRLDGVLLS
jgi:hypothetical protein